MGLFFDIQARIDAEIVRLAVRGVIAVSVLSGVYGLYLLSRRRDT